MNAYYGYSIVFRPASIRRARLPRGFMCSCTRSFAENAVGRDRKEHLACAKFHKRNGKLAAVIKFGALVPGQRIDRSQRTPKLERGTTCPDRRVTKQPDKSIDSELQAVVHPITGASYVASNSIGTTVMANLIHRLASTSNDYF